MSKSLLCPNGRLGLATRLSRRARRIGPEVVLRGSAAMLALFALFGFNPQALAATDTWTGSAGASDFNTAADWGGTLPATGDTFDFTSANASSTATLSDDFAAGFSIAAISYAAASPTYTITGNSFALGAGGITNDSANPQVINDPITLGATPTVFVVGAADGSITLGGAVSDAGGGVTLTNGALAGTLILSDATYTGPTTVNVGTLNITGGTFGSASSTFAVDGNSGTAQTAVATVSGGTMLASTVSIGVNANNNSSLLTIGGNANATFTAVNIGAGGVNTGGGLDISTTGTVSLGTVLVPRDTNTATSGLTVQSGTVSALSVDVNAAGGSTVTNGNLNISGGSLTITNATGGLKIGDINNTNAAKAGHAAFLSMTGGTLTYLGSDGLLACATPTTGNLSQTGNISITGGVASLTGITLNTTDSTTATSTLAVNNGATLYLGSVGLVANAPTGSVVSTTIGTATIGALASWSTTAPITLTAATTATFQAANSTATAENIGLNGVLSGGGNVNITGPGAVTMTPAAANSYTGTTTVTGGTLEFGNLLAQSTGGGAITVNSGATLAIEIGTGGNNFTNGTSGAGTIGGLITSVGAGFQPGSSLGIDTTLGSTSYAGNLASAGVGLTVFGGNNLSLSGTNTYTGATNVNAGRLILNSNAPLGNTAIAVASGASLVVNPALGAVAIGSAGGAGLTLAGGSSLALGSTAETTTFNTVTLNGGVTIGGASAANLTFALNGTSNDELIVTGAAGFGAGGGVINLLTPSISTAPSGTMQTYTLVSAGSGLLNAGGFTLASGSQVVSLGGKSYNASLIETGGTTEILTLNQVTLTYYWVGGTSSSWSTPQNFSTDHTGATLLSSQMGATNDVILTADSPSGTHTASRTLDNSYTINSLSFSSTASAINLGTGSGGSGASNTLTLTAASGFGVTVGSTPVNTSYGAGIGLVMQNGSAAQTLNVPVALGSSQTWELDSATHALTAQGVISDGGAGNALTKTGAGTLILQNAETYSGGTIVSGGTIQLGSGGSLLSASPLTVQGTGTFDLGGNSQTIGALSDGGVSTGTITSSSGTPTLSVGSGTYSGMMSGNISVTETGSSTLTLSGANSFTGPTTVNSGTLVAASNSALGSSASSTGGLVLTGTSVADFTSVTPSIASLTGASGNRMILGNASAGGAPTTLTVTGAGAGAGTTFAGVISDASAADNGNLTLSGGSLTLSGANTFSGTTLVSGGTLTIGSAVALQNSTLNLGAGTFSFGTQTTATFGALAGSGSLAAGTVALTIGGNGSTNTYSGSLTGSGAITTVNTMGVQTLSNDNNTGNLNVGAGGAGTATDSLTISGGTFGSSTSTLTIQSSTEGTAFDMTGGTATFETVNIATGAGNTGSGMTISGGSATFGATNLGSGTDTGGNLIISGSSTSVALGTYIDTRDENGGLEVEGATVTATTFAMTGSGATHGVATTVSGGSLTIGNSSSTGAFEIASGGTGPGDPAETLNVSGGSLTYLGTDGLLLNIGAFPTAVSLTGGVTSLTGMTLDDVNSATVASTLAVNNGATLYLGSVGLKEGSTPTADSGATVTLGTATIGALANWSTSVPLALTTGDTTTFQAADANSLAHNITLNGAISGGGNIATIGAGEEVLSALNNYTGSTSVMAGTLEVSGSLSATSSVSVQSGTLELAANNALAQTAPIMLNAGVLQVLASQSEALGTLTLNGGASTLSLGASGDVINFADSSALAWTGTLTISDWTGLSAGGGSDEVFIGTTNDLTAAQLADITFTNGTLNGVSFGSDSAVQLADGELVAAAIPEPGTWAMMLAGAGMLCVWRRSCGARGAERTV